MGVRDGRISLFGVLLISSFLVACGGSGEGGGSGAGGGSGGEVGGGGSGGTGDSGGSGGAGGSGGGGPTAKDPFEPPSGSESEPEATDEGVLIGDPVTKTIGPDGGTIAFEGGPTLEIPAGALAEEVEISIQLQEGMAPHRLGSTFSFGPSGTTFAEPVKVRFPFPTVLTNEGSVAGIGVAYQDGDGFWNALPEVEVDTEAREVVAHIDHFSSWTLFQQLELRPGHRTIRTGQVAGVWVYRCTQDEVDGLKLLPNCVGVTEHGKWAVNGVAGGNETVGTLLPMMYGASYEAPEKKPSPDTVTITTEISLGKGKGMLFAEVTVVDGPCTFENPCEWEGSSYWENVMFFTAVSHIRWVVEEELSGQVIKYKPVGKVTASFYNCTMDPDTFDLEDSQRGPLRMLVDYGQTPPDISFTETVAMFETNLVCGFGDHDYSMDSHEAVEFTYLGSSASEWDEDGESFSFTFDDPEYPWHIGGYRFTRR